MLFSALHRLTGLTTRFFTNVLETVYERSRWKTLRGIHRGAA